MVVHFGYLPTCNKFKRRPRRYFHRQDNNVIVDRLCGRARYPPSGLDLKIDFDGWLIGLTRPPNLIAERIFLEPSQTDPR